VPVTLSVHLAQRPARTVEAVAYFVVSEALTNVVKHARASQVQVQLTHEGALLRVRVVDDGIGGADPARGTGLTGLRQRVASVDGQLTIESPVGGPTVLEVSLPCGW
jgi:signal transduction histidine kinase